MPLSDIDFTFYTVISNLTARTRAIESAMEYTRQFMVREKIDRQLSVKCTAIVFFQNFTILLSTLVSLCTKERSTVTDSCQSSARQFFSFFGNILGHWPYINSRCSEPVQVRFLQGVFLLVQNLSPWSMSFWAYGSNLYSNLVLKYRSWPSSE